ncbi:MAG: tetratricopeptide repeat protein [Acidobacteria bacterium]|nr:tetratricopeptide repeat protein [Acidobacteriota bacterium]
MRWFGGDALANQLATASPWEKGERLARLVRQTRTLLILDGLEPVQHPPGPQEGRLKEQSLQALLRELAAQQPGLCVISTREAVGDLTQYEGRAVERHDLTNLSPQAGARLLRELKVKGTDAELEAAAREYDGHSLALTLLSGYLNDVFGGDVRRRREIGALTSDAQHGGHARRVMASYEKWLGDGPEMAVLRLLGLFDRPADAASIAALRAAPAIPGLTDALFHVERQSRWFGLSRVEKAEPTSDKKWRQTLAKLRRIKLLAERPSQASREAEDELDAHPLVREHFSQQLRRDLPEAWRAAHNRLYEHLMRTTPDLPDTLAGLTPLIAAVAHGCAAGMAEDAFRNVYMRRIERGNEAFPLNKLGAFGADLAALQSFFATPWREPLADLTADARATVLNAAGFRLRALGRLPEAAQPMQASLTILISQEDWAGTAAVASNLGELYLTLGDLSQARATAQQSIELADRSGNLFLRMLTRAKLADALHQSGHLTEAEAAFRGAEALQKELQPAHPLLYSLQGFLYCDFLLGRGRKQEVRTRAAQTLKWIEQAIGGVGLLDIALTNLMLGRAHLLATGADSHAAAPFLHRAMDGLQQAGDVEFIARGLLARAALYRLTGDHPPAQRDLDEAMRIATRGSMRLYEADCHLESARLALATGDRASARKVWETAKAMIEEMGYHRRDEEVAEIEAKLNAN